jgi:hypothetical protein
MTQLCTYSKSEVHDDLILESCPLGLKSTECKKCPCRKRLYDFGPYDLRVLSCCYPENWRGEPIRHPEAIVANIRGENKRPPRPTKPAEEKPMSEENRPEQEPGTAMTPAAPSTGAVDFYGRIADPLDAVHKLGTAFEESRMFGCKNASQGRVLAMACLAEGRSPVEVMREYHLIDGNLSMKADVMLAKFRQAGGDHEIVERSPDRAAIVLKLKRKSHSFEFTWEQAKGESYVYAKDGRTPKDNWSTPRRRMQMLWARCVSDAVRAVAPECMAGHYTPEELGHHQDDVTEVTATVVRTEPPVSGASVSASSSDVAPEPEPAQVTETEVASPTAAVTRDQLVEMKGLKDALELGPNEWKQIVERFGVVSAKDLDTEQAEDLLTWLRQQADKDSVKNELEQWAKDQLPDPE